VHMHIIPAPPRRPPSPAIMPHTVTALPAADEVLSRGCELPPSGVEPATPDAASARDRLGRERRAQRRPGARRSQPIPDAVLAVCRFQSAADEVPAGAGASSPSRRSSRRAGERSQRPGSDWPSMMVLCWCRKKRMPLSKKRKASQLAKRLGWAMPHASGRAGTLSGRSALAMMKRGEQRASDENWRWRAMDVGNYARGAELTGGRSRPGLGGEGGPTQGSGRSGHLPSGGAR